MKGRGPTGAVGSVGMRAVGDEWRDDHRRDERAGGREECEAGPVPSLGPPRERRERDVMGKGKELMNGGFYYGFYGSLFTS